MVLYIIFQDPLYSAIERASNIKPVEIPGGEMLQVGYADDTNLFTGDDLSFVNIF